MSSLPQALLMRASDRRRWCHIRTGRGGAARHRPRAWPASRPSTPSSRPSSRPATSSGLAAPGYRECLLYSNYWRFSSDERRGAARAPPHQVARQPPAAPAGSQLINAGRPAAANPVSGVDKLAKWSQPGPTGLPARANPSPRGLGTVKRAAVDDSARRACDPLRV